MMINQVKTIIFLISKNKIISGKFMQPPNTSTNKEGRDINKYR